MAYDLAKVTANGNNLIAQILANKSSLSIDKIEISDTQLPSTTDISTMTSVPKVVQTVSANGFSKNSNTLIISTVVDNSSIRADYKAWVFGIWGSDSQNGQSQLIAVITSTNSPDTIPAFSGSTPVSYTYKFNIGFSNASQIQFNMIDDSFATNDTVVHTTGDETIDGQKKFKTDPTDGAGNAYAKTVDVNQQLDKKVNVADMRKPASDVAGIEEVNAKQDKIAYTPADDSKVFHSTVTQLNSTDMNTVLTAGFYTLNSGTNGMPNADAWTIYQVIPLNSLNGVQVAYQTNNAILGMRSWNGGSGKASFTNWIQFADDSKVAHLSGTNNFDTVPTVNNNPLLLASSLPSDLARTGQANTFTAAQTFSIAPTITDASKDKGDNQAATMADLKSVENSAWHIMSGSSDIFRTYNCWYKINKDKKRLEIVALGSLNKTSDSGGGSTALDLSSIITSISSVSGILIEIGYNGYDPLTLTFNGAKLEMHNFVSQTMPAQISANDNYDSYKGNPAYVYYDDLQDAYK